MAMGKDLQLGLWFTLLAIVFVGGVNWLVTGIRSMNDGSHPQVEDLLELMGLPQEASNIIYFVVFAASLAMVIWALFYQYKM